MAAHWPINAEMKVLGLKFARMYVACQTCDTEVSPCCGSPYARCPGSWIARMQQQGICGSQTAAEQLFGEHADVTYQQTCAS